MTVYFTLKPVNVIRLKNISAVHLHYIYSNNTVCPIPNKLKNTFLKATHVIISVSICLMEQTICILFSLICLANHPMKKFEAMTIIPNLLLGKSLSIFTLIYLYHESNKFFSQIPYLQIYLLKNVFKIKFINS